MTATLPDLLNSIDRASTEMAALTKAATALARAQMNANGDDDEWTRLPKANLRCPVSGCSRSWIAARVKLGLIRRRSVNGLSYYSARDWRELLAK